MENRMISVLYVDDEEMLLDIGKLFLEKSGDCSVDVAVSARQGIEQLGKKTYDAIVSDYQMPEMDGIEFLKKIRTTSAIPFILFTGRGREEVVIEAINSGADFYLQKGGDPKSQFVELKHKIIQAVNRRRTEEDLARSETRYRQLVELLPQTIFEIDQTYTITSINPVALQTFGYTRDDLEKGVKVFEVFSPDDHQRIRENIQKIFQGSSTGAFEYTARRKDGSTFPVITYSVPIMRENIPVGLRGVLVDITERKAAEQATLQVLSLLKSTLESTADGILVISREGRIVNYNEKFAEMWHIPEDILKTGNDAEAINYVLNQLKEPQQFLSLVQELYKNPLEISFDVIRFVDGRIFERYSQPQKLGNEVTGRVWSFRDVTKRILIEDALRESEIRYRTIFENTGTAMIIIEEDTTIGFANNEFFRLTGYSQEDIDSRKSWTEFVHRGDLEKMIGQHKLRREKSGAALRQYEFRLLTKSGKVRNILLTIDMFPGTKQSIASLIDITDRKEIEESMRESEEKYRNLSETTHDIIITTDFDGVITYANPAAKAFVGNQQLIGKAIKDFMYPDQVKKHQEMLESRRKGFLDILSYEWPVPSLIDGSTIFFDVRSTVLFEHGKPYGIMFDARDISDRKRVEEVLRDSEEKYRIVAEGASDGIAIIQGDRLEYVNPRLAHMVGFSVEELTGASFIQFISLESLVDLLAVVKKAFSGEPVPTIFQTRIRHHDGHQLEIEASGTSITWKGKKALLGFIRDISNQTRGDKRSGDTKS